MNREITEGSLMSELMTEEQRTRKREQWKRWAAKNKDYLITRDKKRRSTEEYRSNRRMKYSDNPGPHRERCRQWRMKNPEKANDLAKIRAAHARYRARPDARERERQKALEWRIRFPEKVKEYARISYQRNPGIRVANLAKYRAKQRSATPRWLTDSDLKEIKSLYVEANRLGLTVDHIVPLRGKTVSGLHVPWNLQLLSASDNSKKGNRHYG